MKIPPIETDRLVLRGFTPEDAGFAIGIWNDPATCEYLTDEPMETVSGEYLREVEALGEDEACCYLIAVDKAAGARVGTCSFILRDGVCDIAYCVSKEYWRRGYATEMALGMRDYAKGQGARRLTVSIFKGNAASMAIAEKLGCRVVSERPYRKKDRVLTEYQYEGDL